MEELLQAVKDKEGVEFVIELDDIGFNKAIVVNYKGAQYIVQITAVDEEEVV